MSSCEYCGSIIPREQTVCPKCGASVKSGDVSESVKEFERLLIETSDTDNINYLRKSSFEDASLLGKIGWIIIWLFTWPVMMFVYIFKRNSTSTKMLTPSEIKRSNIISNYLFTNDRKTLLEALIFIQTQIDIFSEMKKDGYMQYWVNLWTSKAEQVYEKAKISVGEDAKIEEIYRKIKKESERLNGLKTTFFLIKLVLATTAFVAAFIIISTPFRIARSVLTDEVVIDRSIKRTEKLNEISADNVVIAGVFGQCFELASDKAVIELTDDDTKMEVTVTVKCKKPLADEIAKKIDGKIPDYNVYKPLSGTFFINHPIGCYFSDYNLEGVVATELYNQLLNAEPGDVLDFHLIHLVDDIYPPQEYTNVMTSSTLALSLEATFSHGSGDDFIYETVK